MFPLNLLRKRVVAHENSIEIIRQELLLQRTNHLTHIEANTEKTVEVLEKLVERTAEQTGYLKAIAEKR